MSDAPPPAEPARFVTLEGGEGAGKSTQARLLAAALAAAGLPVLRTREPGGAPGAEAIRRLLLGEPPSHAAADPGAPPGPGDIGWDPLTEALLHVAARREHLVWTIRPALAAGRWVVCDRFADSTLAYQGHGAGVPRETLDALARLALDGARPDLTLVLDIDPAMGLARAARRGEANRYEAADPGFHARVRAGFRAIAAAEPARCVLIDAAPGPEAVTAALVAALRQRFGVP